jgi:hypothetical protein
MQHPRRRPRSRPRFPSLSLRVRGRGPFPRFAGSLRTRTIPLRHPFIYPSAERCIATGNCNLSVNATINCNLSLTRWTSVTQLARVSTEEGNGGSHLTGVTTTCSAKGFTTRFAGDTEARRRTDPVCLPASSRKDVARIWHRAATSWALPEYLPRTPPCAKFAQHSVIERTEG